MRFPGLVFTVLAFGLSNALAQEKVEARKELPISTALVDSLLTEAKANNPSILAATARRKAAEINADSVRTWEDPMAMFGGSVYSDRGFKPSEEGNLAYGIEQKLPLWGRPKLAMRAAQSEASVKAAELNVRTAELRHALRKALLRIALAEEMVRIAEEHVASLKATAQTTNIRFQNGQGSVGDTLQIENEVSKGADALRTTRNELAHEQLSLNRLLNRQLTTSWPTFRLPEIAPAIPLSDRLLSLAIENEPKLKVLAEEISQAQANAELTKKTRLPDVSLGVEGRQYSGDGEFRSGMFSLKVSLPWINGDKYRKDYAREKEKENSAIFEREEEILTLKEALHHLSVGIEAARREALLQKGEILPRSEQALRSRLTDWESGKGGFRDVLESRRMLLESEVTLARATQMEHELLSEMLLWTGLTSIEELVALSNEKPLLQTHNEVHSPR